MAYQLGSLCDLPEDWGSIPSIHKVRTAIYVTPVPGEPVQPLASYYTRHAHGTKTDERACMCVCGYVCVWVICTQNSHTSKIKILKIKNC